MVGKRLQKKDMLSSHAQETLTSFERSPGQRARLKIFSSDRNFCSRVGGICNPLIPSVRITVSVRDTSNLDFYCIREARDVDLK